MRLLQMQDENGERSVAVARDGAAGRRINGALSVYALANAAIAARTTLAAACDAAGYGETIDLDTALKNGHVLSPIDHPDPAHVFLTGTGLTHLGSADARDRMHAKAQSADATDSMKMFRLGLEGGKPESGAGVQPEWFYKGDGTSIVAPRSRCPRPASHSTAARSPSSPASTSSARIARRSAWASHWPTNSPTTSPSG